MKTQLKMIYFIIIAFFMTVLMNAQVELSTKKTRYKLTYNGLLWVILDYWSIRKERSTDKPLMWLKLETSNVASLDLTPEELKMSVNNRGKL